MGSIGSNAFSSCYSLESVYFKDCVKNASIAGDAFRSSGTNYDFTIENCDGLGIGYAAFGESSINNFSITGAKVSYGSEAFGATTIQNFTSNTYITTLGSKIFQGGSVKNVEFIQLGSIPADCFNNNKSLNKFEVKYISDNFTIGGNAFSGAGNGNLEINIEANNVTIGDGAFGGANLKKITITGRKLTVGSSAFAASTIPTVVFDTTETTISGNAFEGAGLNSIYIKELKSIGSGRFNGANVYPQYSGAFSRATNLSTVTIDSCIDGVVFGAYAFCGAGSTSGFSLTINGNNVTLGTGAFQDSILNDITVNGRNLTVNGSALSGSAVKNVYFNTTTTVIGSEAFRNCGSLKTLYIYELTSIADGYLGNDVYNNHGVFSYCKSLESVVIDGIKYRKSGENEYCDMLENQAVNMGAYAFASAGKNMSVTIRGDYLKFSSNVFSGASLNNVNIYVDNIIIDSNAFYGTTLNDANFYGTVETINGYAFEQSSVKNVYIKKLNAVADGYLGNDVYSGHGVFSYCKSLKTFTVDELADNFSFGEYSFYNSGSSLKMLVSGKNASIKGTAFKGTSISYFRINGENLTIGSSAFYGSSIQELFLNTKNTVIGSYAFEQCGSLKKVTIYELASIGGGSNGSDSYGSHGTFSYNKSLEEFTVGNALEGLHFTLNTFAQAKSGFKLNIHSGTDVTFDSGSITGTVGNILLNVDSVSFNSSFSASSGAKAILKSTMTDYSTIESSLTLKGYTVEAKTTGSEYVGATYSPDGNVVYIQLSNDFSYTLYEIKDKTITSLTLIENCVGMYENVLNGTNLTYNIINGGSYLGSSSNQYKALVEVSSGYTYNQATEFIYPNCFNSSSNVTITLDDSCGEVSALNYKNAGSVTFIIPSTWKTIGPSKYNTSGIVDLDQVNNVKVSFSDDNEITYISKDEFNSLLYTGSAKPKNKKYINNFDGTLDIVSYSKVGTSSSHEYLIGEMLYGELTGYTGKVFYIWTVANNLSKAIRVYEDNDTYKNFKGFSSNDEDFYYLTSAFCSTMVGDGIVCDDRINLKACILTSNGIEVLAEKTITLENASLDKTIPQDQSYKIRIGRTINFNDLLVEMGVPHAVRCVTTFNARVIEGADLIDFYDTYFTARHLGDLTIYYDCKSTECYCHGEPETVYNRVFHFEIVCEENSFMEGNKCISINLNPTEYYCDLTKKSPTLTVVDNTLSKTLELGTDYIIGIGSKIEGIYVDTYYVVVEGIGDYFDYRVLTWDIIRRENPVTLTQESYIYDDEKPNQVLTGNKSTGEVKYEYKVKDADDSTYTTNVPKNAGNYTIRVTIKQDNCYYASTATCDYEIKIKVIPLPKEDKTVYTYARPSELLYWEYIVETSEYYTNSDNQLYYPGSKDVVYTLKDKANTIWENESTDDISYLFVLHKPTVPKITGNQTYYYDGSPHCYKMPNNDFWTYGARGYDRIDNATITDVGILELHVFIIDENYTWEDGTTDDIILTVEILKNVATIKIWDVIKYVGEPDSIFFNYDVVEQLAPGIGTYFNKDDVEIERDPGEEIGTYEIRAVKDHYVTDNYDVTILPGTLTIGEEGFDSKTEDDPYDPNPFVPTDPNKGKTGTTNIFKCIRHWLILVLAGIYLIIELLIIMFVSKEKTEETLNKNKKIEIITVNENGKDIKKKVITKYKNGKEVRRKEEVIKENTEDGVIKEESRFIKYIKESPLQSNLLLVTSLIYFIIFIILCIYGRCFICFLFLLALAILIIIFTAYALLPLSRKVIDKYKVWNKKRKEAYDKKEKAEPKTFIEKVKAKAEEIVDKALNATEKGLEKAEEVANEMESQVSLSDATKAALLNPPTFLINKKTIADYLEEKYQKEDVIVNRKANVVANTKLPLADTHYVKIMEGTKENKACFVYVYELETMYMDKQCSGMLLLMKSDKAKLDEYKKAHKSMKISAFPIGGQWIAMPIDSSYDWAMATKLLDEAYDYQMGLLKNKLEEKRLEKEAKEKAKKEAKEKKEEETK